MKFRVWLKSRVADWVLAPLREELTSLVKKDSYVLEFGCGTGDFLIQAAPLICYGKGIDLDPAMIEFANSRKQKQKLTNLDFVCDDALKTDHRSYDVVASTLCLHALHDEHACRLLDLMVKHSRTVLIADYSVPSSLTARAGIELDELFSGHYRNFRRYMRYGTISAYADRVGAQITQVRQSVLSGISIWIINGKSAK